MAALDRNADDVLARMRNLIRREEAQVAVDRIINDEARTLADFEKISSAFQGAKRSVAWAAARTARAQAALREYDA